MTTRLPWDYGEEAEHIFRDYVKLRYCLLPYIYTYSVIAAEKGLPILRAMALEFPDDPLTHALDLQYMFGSELLVAPVYNVKAHARSIFPPGNGWISGRTRS